MRIGALDSFILSTPVAASRTRDTQAEDPKDTRGEAVPAPAPARPSVPMALLEETSSEVAPETSAEREKLAWYRTLRSQAMPEIAQLTRQLEAKQLEGKDFQEAASTLVNWRDSTDDPLIRRAASQVVGRHFKWKDNLQDWQMKRGVRSAGRELAAAMVKQVSGHSGSWFTPAYLETALGGVVGSVRKDWASPATVRDLAGSASAWYRRAEQKLDDKVRENESPQDDHKYGDACVDLLERLWQRGDFQVARNGLILPSGSTSLAEVLRERKVPVSREGVMDLTPPSPGPSDPELATEATELSRKLTFDSWKKEPDPCLAEFDQLVGEKPERARQVADELVRQALHGQRSNFNVCSCIGTILSHGTPEAARLFDRHAHELSRYTERAVNEGRLDGCSSFREGRIDLYQGLLSRYPALATPELLADQLLPLAINNGSTDSMGAGKFLCEQMARVPGGAQAVMDRFLEDPPEHYLTQGAWKVVDGALDAGWKPGPLATDWLAGFAYTPGQSEDDAVSRSGKTLALQFRVMGKLAGSEKLELPGPDGTMMPYRQALVERMLCEPKADVRDYFSPVTGSNSQVREGLKELYGQIFPDPALENRLLERFETAYQATGSFRSLPRPAQMAITLLGSTAMSPEVRSRLRPLLANELERDQGWYVFNDIVNDFRNEYKAEQTALITSPDSDPPVALEAARNIMRTDLFRTNDFSLDSATRPGLDALSQRFQGEDGQRLRDQLLTRFTAGLVEVSGLSQLDRATQVDGWIGVDLLLRDGPPSLEQLESLAGAGKPCDYGAQAMKRLQAKLAEQAEQVGKALLSEQDDPTVRLRAVDLRQLAGESSKLPQIWREDACQRGGLEGELASSFEQPGNALDAFKLVLGQDDARQERWEAWKRLSSKLGGESQHEAVLEAARQWVELRATGMATGEADRIALARYIATGDGGPAVTGVSLEDGRAVIGGVRLAIKKRS